MTRKHLNGTEMLEKSPPKNKAHKVLNIVHHRIYRRKCFWLIDFQTKTAKWAERWQGHCPKRPQVPQEIKSYLCMNLLLRKTYNSRTPRICDSKTSWGTKMTLLMKQFSSEGNCSSVQSLTKFWATPQTKKQNFRTLCKNFCLTGPSGRSMTWL